MLRELLAWLLDEGMHGIVAAGTTGEWFSLSAAEKRDVFETVGQELAGKMTIIAGCNAYTAKEAIATEVIAAKAGFDGILLAPPPYVRPSSREIEAYFHRVSDAAELPICVYNWPPGTGVDMDLELLTQLARLDNVVAIKNSTSSWDHFLDVFHALHKDVRIFGVPMDAAGMDLVLKHGADGMMGAGGVLGRKHAEFFEALWRNDLETAESIAKLDRTLMGEWFTKDLTGQFGSAQAILKTALNLQGLPGGYPRDPILPLSEADIEKVRSTLVKLGINVIGQI